MELWGYPVPQQEMQESCVQGSSFEAFHSLLKGVHSPLNETIGGWMIRCGLNMPDTIPLQELLELSAGEG